MGDLPFPPLSLFQLRAFDADALPARREPRRDSPDQRSVRCGCWGGWLFFVLWTTFFPTFSPPPLSLSPITDCPSLGQILFMILEEVVEGSCSLFSARKTSAQTWKLQRSPRLFICRRVESVPVRRASGISPQNLPRTRL